jgi:DNA-directed RNA polymerase specialized sigma24 family protein
MEMVSEESITFWVGQLRAGDAQAARRLWERYYENMVDLARRKLSRTPCHWADEEDVALSAFKSFCHGAANGRFPDEITHDNLWRLLFALTARKAVDLTRRVTRQKRNTGAPTGAIDMELLPARDCPPDFAAQLDEQRRQLFDRLPDPQLRAVAEWKMEGFTSAEIAVRLGCAERTVERKLRVIRRLWQEEVGA